MDNLTQLNIMMDYYRRVVADMELIRNCIIANDRMAFNVLLRYYRHVRNYAIGSNEPIAGKREVAARICDIMETYLKERNEKEVKLWTETD